MNLADWTLDRLFSTLREIKGRAAAADSEIGANNIRGVQLYEAAKQLPDPNERARVMRSIEQWGARQVAIVRRHLQFAQAFRDATARVKGWLATIGVQMPAGLGVGPAIVLVPLVVVAAVIVAYKYVESVRVANETQRQGLAQSAEVLSMLRAGQIDGATATRLIDSTYRQANQQTPDLLGLGQLGEILVPLAIVAGVVMILPAITGARRT